MDSPPPSFPRPSVPPQPAARRVTRKVCWVLSLLWLIGWPLAVSTLGVWRGRGDQTELAWATTWYPIAMLWVAYWLVAWFFWVRWGAIWAAATEPAPVARASADRELEATSTVEAARS